VARHADSLFLLKHAALVARGTNGVALGRLDGGSSVATGGCLGCILDLRSRQRCGDGTHIASTGVPGVGSFASCGFSDGRMRSILNPLQVLFCEFVLRGRQRDFRHSNWNWNGYGCGFRSSGSLFFDGGSRLLFDSRDLGLTFDGCLFDRRKGFNGRLFNRRRSRCRGFLRLRRSLRDGGLPQHASPRFGASAGRSSSRRRCSRG
jgi:hypothetical protein